MEELKRFDIATYRGNTMVVIESEMLPPDPAIVVIPLLSNYPAIQHLNPTIHINGEKRVLATRLIGAVRRSALKREGSALDQAADITRAVDVLLAGI